MTIQHVSVSAQGWGPNIWKTDKDRGLVPKDHQWEMTHGESNDRVTDDITWPWKVNVVTPICLELSMADDSDLVLMEHL